MTETVDHLVPVSVVASRLESSLEQIRADIAATPWWRWRRRLILQGSAATYAYELDQLLGITGSWQPVWDRISGKRP